MPADLALPDLGLRPEMVLDAYERLAGGFAPQTALEFDLERRIQEAPQRRAFYEVVRHMMDFLREYGWGERQFVRSGFVATTNLRYRAEIPEEVRGRILADPANACRIAFPGNGEKADENGPTTGLVIDTFKHWTWASDREVQDLDPRMESVLVPILQRNGVLDMDCLRTEVQDIEGSEKLPTAHSITVTINEMNKRVPPPFRVKSVKGRFQLLQPRAFMLIERL